MNSSNRKKKSLIRRMDIILLIVAIILFAFGLLMVYSSSNVASYMKFNRAPYAFFIRQLIFVSISFMMAFFIIRFSTKSYGYISWVAIISVIVLLIIVLIYGSIVNQAKSWIGLFGGATLQPSEFAKIITIIWFATNYAVDKNETKFKTFLLLFGIVLLIAVLIMLQPDLGTTTIYLTIVLLMFTALPISRKVKRNVFLSIIGLGCIVVVLLMNNGVQVFFERQLERFDYFNPCSEEKFLDSGSQVCNSYIAINNGGLFGKGLGNSTQKYLYLPEAYTDFIFAIVVEELGFIGGVFVLLLLFVVLWRIFIIGKFASNDSSKLMCYGIFWYLLLHIIVNLGGIMGLIPLTGVPLPFLSYGGSFTMCLVVALTIVQRVAIESKIKDVSH